MYFGDMRLVGKWGVHTEAQWRRANGLRDPLQNFARIGINYHACDALMLTGGYAFADTHPYGDYPSAHNFPEHRLYEQLQMSDSHGRVQVSHRYRLEQRWVRYPGADDYTYLNRTRYQLRVAVPLFGPKIVPRMPYIAAYDEIFIGFGRNVAHNIFDQNRLYGALGYQVRKGVNIEGGYLYQVVQQRNGQVFEHNHTLQLGVTLNLDWRRGAQAADTGSDLANPEG
jgi:hypothetical protein